MCVSEARFDGKPTWWTAFDCQTGVDVHATSWQCQSTAVSHADRRSPRPLPGTSPLRRSRSIAPWPPFARNTNGRLRSTRIDWLLPSGECIVVTYAARRAFSPPCPFLVAVVSRPDVGPSADDRCDTGPLIRHDIWRRSTNKRRRRSFDVRLSTPSGTQRRQ